ncbi:Histone-lysine N-methyltransferase SETMAR-like Protein [Tribolium castaneum]|uniref:Histone-lysine N-methyltransferase SETMAR-like Protein n=1 Tax=Tribolium castaneum TaxID=7070 RepID=D7GYJ0_TRICA|nr:Histone-lysine N-methyltransferase SETMAR-like Protein [Tribolium castaneum]
MEQTEIRAVIKYFFIKGLSSKDIKSELDNTLGDSSPSYTTIKTWVADFKRGRKSTEDAPRSGRPKTATCKEIVEKVHKIVLNDRRSKLVEIAEAVGISTERVHYILTEVLDMRKLSARWVPRLLTPEQKLIRKMISEECLARLQHNPVDFLRRFITVDETWIHHYSPETKQQSKQWTAKGEPVPKKAKTLRSAGKVSIGMLRKNALARPETFQFILVCNMHKF